MKAYVNDLYFYDNIKINVTINVCFIFYEIMLGFLKSSGSNHLIANDCQNCVLSIQNLFDDRSLSEPVTKSVRKSKLSER